MAYAGQIARILISAPGDLGDEDRRTIVETVNAWNVREGETHGVAFVPMHWSSDAAAEYGIRPQESINQQLVDRADVVIALFWTRLGTPTGEAESGTVEELTRAAEAGRYVAVLRCRRPVDPSGIDTAQLAALETFFETHRGSGLVKDYDDDRSLEREVANILLLAAGRAQGARVSGAIVPSRRLADVWATSGYTDNMNVLVLENRGQLPALDLTFEVEPMSDAELPRFPYGDGPVEVLPPGSPMGFPVIVDFDSPMVRCTVRWYDEPAEEGVGREVREQVSTVRF